MKNDNDLILEQYRPKSENELIISEKTFKRIANLLLLIHENKIRCILISGPTGSGKTTLARIIASQFELNEIDFFETDCATDRGIDFAREISKYISAKSLGSKNRVLILDEAHMLTTQAQNAFLKTLESIPSGNLVIICTTNIDGLISTILSRCYKIDLSISEIDKYFLSKIEEKYIEIFHDLYPKFLDKDKSNIIEKSIELVKGTIEPVLSVNKNISFRDLIIFLYECVKNKEVSDPSWLYSSSSILDASAIAKFIARGKIKNNSWEKMVSFILDSGADPESLRIITINYLMSIYRHRTYDTNLLQIGTLLSSFSASGPDGKMRLISTMQKIFEILKTKSVTQATDSRIIRRFK